MKITIVFNNTDWATADEKLQAIKDFYASLDAFEIVSGHTSFSGIPFMYVDTIGGVTNTPGTTTTVDTKWFDDNIASLAPDSDIVLLYLNPTDDDPPRTSVGIMQHKHQYGVQCVLFGINETDHAYIYDPTTGGEIDQGNCFVVFACHEISHALYYLENKTPDNTHAYFYTAREKKVLDDLKNNRWFIISHLINLYYKLLGLYKQQQTIMKNDNTTTANPIPPTPIPAVPQGYTPHPMIYKWAKAIAPAEGARPDLNNPGDLKVTALTKTWGATNGFQATDGGWIAKFPTFQAGFQAQVNLLTLIAANEALNYHKDRTFQGVMTVYANHPLQSYIEQIAAQLGVPVTVDVGTFLV